ncbi:hypothetical protein P4S72_20310 [Vibrio sp. PP-XX7]
MCESSYGNGGYGNGGYDNGGYDNGGYDNRHTTLLVRHHLR